MVTRIALLLLLTACSTPEEEKDEPTDFPTTYEGVSSALYFSMDVGSPDDVDETIEIAIDDTGVTIPMAFCELAGTDLSFFADRAIVDFDLEGSVCSFQIDTQTVDVTIESGLINWERDDLSLLVTGEGSVGEGEAFSIIIDFDGVVVP